MIAFMGRPISKAERGQLIADYDASAANAESTLRDKWPDYKWDIQRFPRFDLPRQKSKWPDILATFTVRVKVSTQFGYGLILMYLSRDIIEDSALDWVGIVGRQVEDARDRAVRERQLAMAGRCGEEER